MRAPATALDGSIPRRIGWRTIVRNVVLISISALIVLPSNQSRISLLVNGLAGVSKNVWLDAAVAVAAALPSLCSCATGSFGGEAGESIDKGASEGETVGFAPRHGPRPDPVSTPVVLLDGRVTNPRRDARR